MTDEILALLNENADSKQADKMSAYMKNMFPFAGIPRPKLRELIRPFLKAAAKEPIDWQLVFDLWDADFRETQYVALEYLQRHHKMLVPADIERLKRLIVTKSWWETVDTLDALVGKLVMKDESLKRIMLEWAKDENIWLRRVAIDFQQGFKSDTDAQLLEEIIRLNLGSKEFFINKAIGWSLRDYSKTDPDWVRRFVEEYGECMAALSVKEATKLL